MKKQITFYFLVLSLLTALRVNGQTCSITGSSSIQVNQTLTYSVSTTAGSSYFWSVTGGVTIVGSNTGASVSVRGVTTGSALVCVTKYKAGSQPCCECKEITVINPPPLPCPPQPSIYMGVCSGYPSVHPHWRFGVLEPLAYDNTGTYQWSGTNFAFDSNTNQDYIIGRPTSQGYFTVYCTVTYNCPSGGTVTYNLSFTYHTDDCTGPTAMASSSPNPFTTSTTVDYSIPEDGAVSLLIKSMEGEIIVTPVLNEFKKAGQYSVTLSGDTFPKSGTYIMDVYLNNKLIVQRRLVKQ